MRVELSEVPRIVERCVGRVNRWRPPPNWSRADWRAEIGALCAASAWAALRDYAAGAAAPCATFIHQRVMADALTFYRREWAFAWRSVGLPCDDLPDDGTPPCQHCRPRGARGSPCPLACSPAPSCDLDVDGAVHQLSPHDQTLIHRIYWQQYTEAEIAADLSISQPAINKRKRRVLLALRARLAETSPGQFA